VAPERKEFAMTWQKRTRAEGYCLVSPALTKFRRALPLNLKNHDVSLRRSSEASMWIVSF